MNNMGKRVLSMILSLSMLLTLLPAPALAAQTDSRGEQLDTQEIYDWLSYEREYFSDEDGAIRLSVSSLITELCNPEAPGNGGRKVVGFTLWDEANDEALVQLGENGVAQAADQEDDTTVVLYSNGDMYVATAIGPEEPALLPEEFLPVVPEEVPVVLEEILVNSEEAPVVPEETPVDAEEAPVEAEETPAEAEEAPVEAEETPAEAEETPAEAEEIPVEAEETPVEAEEAPAEAEETPVEAEEAPVEAEEPEDDDPAEVELEASLLLNSAGMIPVSLWVEYAESADQIPDKVQAFLKMVAALPDSIVTGEDYDAVEAALPEISAMYAALAQDDQDRDDVTEALIKLTALGEQLGMDRPVGLAGHQSITDTVYVYVKVYAPGVNWNKNSSFQVNNEGWYTIGKVKVSGLPDPYDYRNKSPGDDYQEMVVNALSDIELHSDGAGQIKLSDVYWTGTYKTSQETVTTGLQGKSAATSYSETENYYTWHLDGYLYIPVETHSVTIRHWFAEEYGVEGTSPREVDPTQTVQTGQTATFNLKSLTEGTFAGRQLDRFAGGITPAPADSQGNSFVVTVLNSDIVVDVLYKRTTADFSVKYYYDGAEGDAPEGATDRGSGEIDSQPVVTYPDTATVTKDGTTKTYAFDKIEQITISETASDNVVEVYYALDENQDQVPDKYQITVQYEAGAHGNLDATATPEVLTVYKDENKTEWATTGYATTTREVTAHPDTPEGYRFLEWTATSTDDGGNWSVNGWIDRKSSASDTLQNVRLDGVTGGKTYTFTASFTTDTYTVTWNPAGGEWETAPDGFNAGEVSGTVFKELLANQYVVNPENPTREGYVFRGWIYTAGSQTKTYYANHLTAKEFSVETQSRDIQLTAKWELGKKVTIKQHFVGLDGNEILVEHEPTTVRQGTEVDDVLKDLTTDYEADTVVGEGITLEDTYAYDRYVTAPLYGDQLLGLTDVTFDLYYYVDNWSKDPGDDPETGGDGTPDKDQVLVRFVSADPTKGTVTGKTIQVFDASVGGITPETVTTVAESGCAFDCWTENGNEVNPYKAWVVNGGTEITFTAHFDTDGNNDGIPDKYQARVTYKVENGTWEDDVDDDKVVYVTLYEKNADLKWVRIADDKLDLRIPNGMKASTGYVQSTGEWDSDPAKAVLDAGKGHTFTYSFDAQPLTYAVRFFDSETNESLADGEYDVGGLDLGIVTDDDGKTTVQWARIEAEHKISVSGYAFDYVEEASLTLTAGGSNVFNVYYSKDVIGGKEPNPGDGIPDKYQVTVVYQSDDADMGTVSRGQEVLTIDGRKETGDVILGGSDANPKVNHSFEKWTADSDDNSWKPEDSYRTLPFQLTGVHGGKTYTFTAHFKADSYTVVWNSGDGDWKAGTAGVDGSTLTQTFGAGGSVTPPGSENLEKSGYRFTGWTYLVNGTKTPYNGTKTAAALGQEVGSKTIYMTANWEALKLNYTVVQHLRNEKLVEVKTLESKPAQADQNTLLGSLITPYLGNVTDAEKTYIRSASEYRINDGQILEFLGNAKLTDDNTIIHLYYDVDNWSKNTVDDPENTPDGTPDKDQVLVKFESADTSKGTVSGKTQVFDKFNVFPVESGVTLTPKEGYVFDIWVKNDRTSEAAVNPFTSQTANGGDTITFYAKFDKDEIGDKDDPSKPDGIPDKYQAMVTYKVVNGTWVDDTTTAKTVCVTLFVKDADSGVWTEIENPDRQIPSSMVPIEGYDENTGKWNRNPSTAVLDVNNVNEFTYSFEKGSYDYTVEYYYNDVKGDAPPTTANGDTATTGGTATFGTQPDISLEVKQIVTSNGKTYAIESIKSVTIGVDTSKNVVKVYCAKDEMGTKDPDQPDGTPDKYQVKIVYTADSNGSIEGGNKTEVLTIGDEKTSGSVNINGASAKADKYFHFVNWTASSNLSGWDAADHTDVTLSSTTISVNGDSTYTFTANFAVDTYTVIFNAKDGSWDEAPKGYEFVDEDHSKVQKTVNANEKVGVVDDPKYASNGFLGWYFTPKSDPASEQKLPPEKYNSHIQNFINAGDFYEAIEVTEEGVIELTAEWRIQTLTYRYVQHFLNADGKEESVLDMSIDMTADANTPISELVKDLMVPTTAPNGRLYLYSHYNPKDGNLTKDGTVIDLYYSADNWHDGKPGDEDDPDSETGGDGIPDTQQVLVKFVSADEEIGKVNGSTVQVYTLVEGQTSVTLPTDIKTEAGKGYAFDYWTLDGSADELSEIPATLDDVQGGKTYTFTAYFAKDVIGIDPENPSEPDGVPDKYQATVVYLSADANKGTVDGKKQVVTIMDKDGEKYAKSGKVTISGSNAIAKSGYALDYWTLTSTEEDFKEKNMSSVPKTLDVKGDQTYTFTAYFDKDTVSPKNPDPEKPNPTDPGDDIPDKYQVVVTYQIVNGVWSDGTAGDKTEVLTLYQQGNDGKWTDATPKPALTVPTGTPNSGFKGGSWNVVPSMDGLKPATDGVNVFIFTCDPMASNILTVRYVDEYGTEIMGRTTRQLREDAVPVTVSALAISGYVLTSAASQRVTSYQTQTITFTYARDVLSDPNRDGNGSEPGDGIPDSWQYTVTYTATNGTVSMDSTVVTKLDDNGNPSASGTARLAANQIATASRASSAYRDTPSWTPSAPVADMVISADTTFNAAFTVRSGGGGGGGGTGGGGGGTGGGGSTGTNTPATTDITDDLTPLAGDAQLNLDDHFAYIKGYADGTVRPGNYITRAQVATIFYRLMTEQSRAIYYADSNDYTDVADDFWANKAISTLSNAEIITGFSDGTFRPNAYITRAQFAAIAARFDSVVPGLENPFSDVGEDHWARDLIAYAASKGWIGGYDDGTFRPNNNITRAAAMNLINNVLQRHVDEEGLLEDATQWTDNNPGDWHYFVVLEATNSHDFDRREEGELMENWTALNPDPVWDE